jgi:hypothetical protein
MRALETKIQLLSGQSLPIGSLRSKADHFNL